MGGAYHPRWLQRGASGRGSRQNTLAEQTWRRPSWTAAPTGLTMIKSDGDGLLPKIVA